MRKYNFKGNALKLRKQKIYDNVSTSDNWLSCFFFKIAKHVQHLNDKFDKEKQIQLSFKKKFKKRFKKKTENNISNL